MGSSKVQQTVLGGPTNLQVVSVGPFFSGTGAPESPVNSLVVAAYTSIIDFTAVGAVYSFVVPVKLAGYYFSGQRYNVLFTALTGTATVGLTFSIGNDASNLNIVASTTLSTASLNTSAGIGAPIQLSNTAAINISATLVDAGTEIKFKVITPVSTSGTCAGRMVVFGTFVPTT